MDSSSALLRISFAGREFYLSSVGGSDAVAIQMQSGAYEAPLPMLTMGIAARTQGLFVDVGANNGLYSILAAVTRPTLKAIAFEPYPPVIDVLRANIVANSLGDRIKVLAHALSDENGCASLFLPDQSHGLLETSCSLDPNFKANSTEALKVRTRRLDDTPLGSKVSLIKVDIEGHEAAFFRGAEQLLSRDRPFVFAEMLPAAEESFYEISQMMHRLNFLQFRLRADAAILARYIKHDPLAWNYGLIPAEKIDLFRAVCTAHCVDIVQPF